MLKMKYYKNFKGNQGCILVIGNRDDYIAASDALQNSDHCYLDLSILIAIEDLGTLDPRKLTLTADECSLFSQICQRLINQESAAHDYLSIRNFPDVEFLISYDEYNTFP